MFTSRGSRLLPLAALVVAGGCFATRNDVRLVQSDMATMRTELLKGQADQARSLTLAMSTLQVASDSVKAMSNRLTSVQGDVRGGLRNVTDQLLQVQELLRQNSAEIIKTRQRNEQLFTQPQVVAPVAPVPTGIGTPDSAAAMTPPASTTSAAQLYASGTGLLQRGAVTTARSAFQELLTNFPNAEYAPQAQLGIAQSYQLERNPTAAQAAYGVVFTKYPDSQSAPTALYKSARIYQDQGNNAQAKLLYQTIVTKYRTSDEFESASAALKLIK